MKERPILMSGPNIQPILECRKTQTRRVVKSRYQAIEERDDGSLWPWREDCNNATDYWYPCPYGQPGDRLWVRETFGITESAPYADGQSDEEIIYRADGWKDDECYFKWKPSIFMPRWASRILLEITEVRVERLQDISEEDAKAEGVSFGNITDQVTGEIDCDAVEAYESLWESINGAGSWDANPWVWVIHFRPLIK